MPSIVDALNKTLRVNGATIADCLAQYTDTHSDNIAEGVEMVAYSGDGGSALNLAAIIEGSVENAAIPDGTTAIRPYAFYNCTNMKNVNIPDSITSIGAYAFNGCSKLEEVEIPANVTTVGEYAFNACSKLESVEIPVGVTSLGSRCFSECTSLTEITIPYTVATIGTNAFYGCTNLTTITCGFASGDVTGAPWGATNATIVYAAN